jgi:glycosyltransferase involved in cell wall biosynthesis
MSKCLRVAYDISVLLHYSRQQVGPCGIGRVVESLLQTLRCAPSIELSGTVLCGYHHLGGDWFHDAIGAYFYRDERADALPLDPSFRSRFGLTPSYVKHFYRARQQHRPEHATTAALNHRLMMSLLYRLSYRYKFDALKPSLANGIYDVFHSPYPALPSPELTRSRCRVLTIYDLIPVLAPQYVETAGTQFMTQLLNSIRREHDWVACISEFTKNEFCEYTGMTPERVQVTPLAAAPHFRPLEDESRITAAREKHQIPETPYFLTIAEMQPRKNLVHLLTCFRELVRSEPHFSANLVLTGRRGWMYDEIVQATQMPELKSRLFVTGAVEEHDLVALYNGARGFVFPSLYEGFGLPVLEAMQCGVPVIASNTTSLPEVVGDAGWLLAPHDVEGWCGALQELEHDDVLHAQLKQRGLERAKYFSWQRCAEENLRLYRKALRAA